MTSEEYGQYIDDFELGADVMPGESLTEYIERRRREFDSKADGGSIGIEVLFKEKRADGGRIGLKDGLMPEDYLYSMDKDAKGFLIGEDSDKIPEGLPEDYLFKIDDEGKIFIVPTKESEDKRKDVEVEDVEDIIERDTPRLGILSGFSPLAFLRKYLAKKELEAKEENKADGGRVGLFMGGPALEGQALQIYNSMNAYGFSDQEIADALSARGLYTPGGTTQPEQITGIINQQIQTGGGGDNDGQTGFGKFGNLDPTTEKEVTINFYDEEYGDFVPTKTKVYQNTKSGLFQTIDGKNAFPAFSNKGAAFGLTGIIAQALGGKPKTVGGYVPGSIQGKYDGIGDMFSNIKNPLNLFKKQQATIADINAMNKKAVDDLRAKQAAEKAAKEAARAAEMARYNITSDSDFGGGTPGGGGGNVRTTGGDVYGGATRGGYNEAEEKTDYYRDGGLATMFTRRR